MKIPTIPLLLSFILIFTLLPIVVLAENETSLTMRSSLEVTEIGEEILVEVEGLNLKDVYGYELRLSYDPTVMTFHKASSAWEGFSIPAIVENGNIIFAHTKVGNVKGESEDLNLATLRFETSGQGEGVIQLTRVKLVDSKGESTTLEPNLKVKINVPKGHIANFSDIKGHWAEADIIRATEKGWINGYPDGTFGPNQSVTRAQFTTMLSRALALSSQIDLTELFKDHGLIPDYAKVHVSQAAAAGIIKGYDDHTFKPYRWITRSEITMMLMRVLGYEDNLEQSIQLNFADVDQVPAWAYAAIAKASELDIVKGKNNNIFDPKGNTTRAEAVTLILRTIDYQTE